MSVDVTEQIVSQRAQHIIDSEKGALRDLHELAAAGEHAEDARRLKEIISSIDELFLLVIVGEFNSGKSSFINALFGEKVRVEGPIPVDDRITIMHYGDEAEERINSLDHREECRRVIDSAMNAIQQSFGLGASAVGLGYVLATAFTTVALDVTGVAAAAVLFTASFFILPYKRKRAIEEFRAKTEQLRSELQTAFEAESNREIDRAVDNVGNAITPYTRFVRSERAKIEERAKTLAHIRERLAILRREVESLMASGRA